MATQNIASSSSLSSVPPPAPISALIEWLDLAANNPPIEDTNNEAGEKNSHSSIHNNNMISSLLIQSIDPKPYVLDFWFQHTRPDGRVFVQHRPTKVVTGILQQPQHAAGSALVTILTPTAVKTTTMGSSIKILAATTLQIGQPTSPEHSHQGEVVVHVSGGGSVGQGQGQHWDVLQSWLQRVLEEDNNNGNIASHLNLITGKACLKLVVTVILLEDGGGEGNIKDAALLACMAAWKDTKLPQVGKDLIEVQGKLWWNRPEDKETMSSSSSSLPPIIDGSNDNYYSPATELQSRREYRISLTMGVWKHPIDFTTHLLVDPSLQEQAVLDGTLTIVMGLSNANKNKNLQANYTGTVPLAASDLALACKLTEARCNEISRIFGIQHLKE